MKITDNKVQNIKPLEAYLYTNLLVSIIFLLFNPMYALLPILLISLVFGRINEKLIGFLFVISITLMFANQVFAPPSDIASYIHMYQDTKYTTFSNIFYEYIDSINGHELLWFYYSKLLGSLFGYSNEIFILSNYLLIFSLLTYVSYLSSENGRYNFVLILFGLVFLEVTLFSNAYDLWRTEIASLMFILSLLIGYSKKSKYLYRVIMYSSIFVHTTMILLVGLYELYSLFMIKKVFKFHGILFYVKLVVLILSVIILLLSANQIHRWYNDYMILYIEANNEKIEKEEEKETGLVFTQIDNNLYTLIGAVLEGDCERLVPDLPAKFTVILESPGGSLSEGSCLAAHFKLRDVITVVRGTEVFNENGKEIYTPNSAKSEKEKSVCASACGLLFLAGDKRYLIGDVLFGIHSPRTPLESIGKMHPAALEASAYRTATALLKLLDRLEVDESLHLLFIQIPAASMYWVHPEILSQNQH